MSKKITIAQLDKKNNNIINFDDENSMKLLNNLQRLQTLRKIINRLDASDREFFHSYYNVSNMTMSMKLNEDFKTFDYVYQAGAHVSNWDLHVFGGCGIDSKFNKTMFLKEIKARINDIKSELDNINN